MQENSILGLFVCFPNEVFSQGKETNRGYVETIGCYSSLYVIRDLGFH